MTPDPSEPTRPAALDYRRPVPSPQRFGFVGRAAIGCGLTMTAVAVGVSLLILVAWMLGSSTGDPVVGYSLLAAPAVVLLGIFIYRWVRHRDAGFFVGWISCIIACVCIAVGSVMLLRSICGQYSPL